MAPSLCPPRGASETPVEGKGFSKKLDECGQNKLKFHGVVQRGCAPLWGKVLCMIITSTYAISKYRYKPFMGTCKRKGNLSHVVGPYNRGGRKATKYRIRVHCRDHRVAHQIAL